jgi:cell division protein FtsL
MATHSAYVSNYAVIAREERARRLEVREVWRVLAILMVICLVGLLYVGLTSRVAALGREVQTIRERKEALIRQNEELGVQTAELGSIERVAKEALGLGMVPVTQVEYVDTSTARAQTRP